AEKGDWEAIYPLTSEASHQRFGAKAILDGTAYTSAHDYIVNRTKNFLDADHAAATSMQATPGDVRSTGNTTAQAPARIEMTSTRVGSITQDIAIPLVLEKGKWRVDWSPGLVFKQLGDPNDPTYRRRLVFTPAPPAPRGKILDRDSNVLAQDNTVIA